MNVVGPWLIDGHRSKRGFSCIAGSQAHLVRAQPCKPVSVICPDGNRASLSLQLSSTYRGMQAQGHSCARGRIAKYCYTWRRRDSIGGTRHGFRTDVFEHLTAFYEPRIM